MLCLLSTPAGTPVLAVVLHQVCICRQSHTGSDALALYSLCVLAGAAIGDQQRRASIPDYKRCSVAQPAGKGLARPGIRDKLKTVVELICVALQISQLLQLQKQSSDGVIEFDGQRFSQFVVGKRRPYTLFVFLSASHLQDKANLRLTDLRAEFGHTAKAFRTHNANSTWTGKQAPNALFATPTL